MNLNVKLRTKLGCQAGGQPKTWGGLGPLRPPLEPPLSTLCAVST